MQLFFTHVRPGQIKPILQVAIDMYFYTGKRGDFMFFFAFWSQPCLQTSRIAYPTVIKDMWKCLGLLLKFHEGNFTQPKLNRIYGSVPQLKSEVL